MSIAILLVMMYLVLYVYDAYVKPVIKGIIILDVDVQWIMFAMNCGCCRCIMWPHSSINVVCLAFSPQGL